MINNTIFATMSKETILQTVDAMPAGNKASIPAKQVQQYRNVASTLKNLKQKQFVVRKVGTEHVIVRIM